MPAQCFTDSKGELQHREVAAAGVAFLESSHKPVTESFLGFGCHNRCVLLSSQPNGGRGAQGAFKSLVLKGGAESVGGTLNHLLLRLFRRALFL